MSKGTRVALHVDGSLQATSPRATQTRCGLRQRSMPKLKAWHFWRDSRGEGMRAQRYATEHHNQQRALHSLAERQSGRVRGVAPYSREGEGAAVGGEETYAPNMMMVSLENLATEKM